MRGLVKRAAAITCVASIFTVSISGSVGATTAPNAVDFMDFALQKAQREVFGLRLRFTRRDSLDRQIWRGRLHLSEDLCAGTSEGFYFLQKRSGGVENLRHTIVVNRAWRDGRRRSCPLRRLGSPIDRIRARLVNGAGFRCEINRMTGIRLARQRDTATSAFAVSVRQSHAFFYWSRVRLEVTLRTRAGRRHRVLYVASRSDPDSRRMSPCIQ